ncbi:MAG: MFS transporter [Armatimonadota bacterium]|nr:MFS transporter [Armatimonadota bacterium]MDR7611187.1 MFS transporter [Armatimonadota bacterium]
MADPPSPATAAAPAVAPRPGGTFASLRHRNFRLWFAGQLVSLFGTWMQATAQSFLVFELTRSPAYLGYVGFASGMPTWVFMLYGGVVADRMPRRTLLVYTQGVMMLLAFALAAVTFTGKVAPWHVVALAAALGVANAFDAPARQAFVVDLVPRDDLTNAIALNATMFNAATTLGPAAAGWVYATLGPAWCFTINGLTFVAVIAALLLMRLPPAPAPRGSGRTGQDLREGLRYAAAHEPVRVLILVVGLLSLLGISVGTLIPAWAVQVLHGNAATNGLLQSARGVGAVASALFIASVGSRVRRGRLLAGGLLLIPVALLVFAGVRHVALALGAMAVVGAAMILVMNLANAMVQSAVPDDLRGRVMSLYSLVFFGAMPVGALWAGALGERVGAPLAVVISSGLLLALAVGVRLRARWLDVESAQSARSPQS